MERWTASYAYQYSIWETMSVGARRCCYMAPQSRSQARMLLTAADLTNVAHTQPNVYLLGLFSCYNPVR